MLRENGVDLVKRFPEPGSNLGWKASIGLAYNGIVVSYTVWEKTKYQTELLVMNSEENKTIVMNDNSPQSTEQVHADLDVVVQWLLDGRYKAMNPDPKLTIT